MFFRFLRLTALALPFVGVTACASAPRYSGMTADDLFTLGQRQFQEEDWKAAAETLDHLLLRVADPSFDKAAEARFMLAQAYFNHGDYLTAQGEFTRFVNRYPADERAPEAALGVCRSFAELSPIPERDQTYTRQAVSVCQNVVLDYSGIDDEAVQQAREVMNRMRAKLGEKVYLNAMHYFDREFWHSSIIYFEAVVDDYGDTPWAPKAIVGMIDAYEKVGFDEEVEQWRQTLLNSYPDSPEAKAMMDGAPRDTSSVAG